ncbi:CS025 protein, partial [Zosterops hypoxanthus]|nr:CS025 protein [Zosterops hypoxanthus]
MSAKAKRVLPTRPEPPSAEQILADVRGTEPTDPVFVLPAEPPAEPGPAPGGPEAEPEERERLYRQIRSYVGMNQRLQEAREQLRERRRELQSAGEALEAGIAHMRQRAF